MALLERIEKSIIKIPLESKDKTSVIRELVTVLKEAGKIEDTDTVVEAVEAREALCSTGLDRGIAVPHAKTTAVDDLTIAIGISPGGIDYDALDGEDSKVFFLILPPPDQSGPHVQALSEIAKMTQSANFMKFLLRSENAQEVVDLFLED